MEVKVINKSSLPLPEYGTSGSAGVDLRADIESEIVIYPMQRMVVPTGLYMAIPEGYMLSIRPRSGLSLKEGLTVVNTPGTIDGDYRNEIGVILINLSNEPRSISPGMRIAQGVLIKYETIEWCPVDELDSTERNGGFGSTGTN